MNTVLSIGGMTCASCVARVEKALETVPGVERASVNLVTGKATVAYRAAVPSLDALAEAVRDAGYEVTAEAAPEEDPRLRRDLWISAALSVPLVALAMSHGAFGDTRWAQLALATLVIFGPGLRFFRLGLAAARHRSPDMNTLIALGAGAAWTYSTAAVLAPGLFPAVHGGPPVYFEAAGAIFTFVLLGKVLEGNAKRRLSDAVRGLVALQPREAARILDDGAEVVVPIASLQPGWQVRVRPGERVAVDGAVVEGTSAVDEAMLTGESLPVDKAPGAKVYAGTINGAGALRVEVTSAGAGTALARIVEAVEQAQGSKAPIARLADRISAVFVPVVLGIAAVTGAVWLASGAGIAAAIQQAVAVLVIACPCALGLATPAAVAAGTGRGAELGILVKGGEPLEAASRIDTVLVDKTGTLTTGRPALTDVIAVDGDRDGLLRRVAAAERASEHPVARAIVAGASGPLPEASGFATTAGGGVSAVVEGRRVQVGTAAWLGVDVAALEPEAERLASAGRTPSFVAVDGTLAGLVAVADRPTESAAAAIAALKAMGIRVAMVTGDRRATGEAIARELGIDRVYAEVRPEGKAAVIAEERAAGRRVAMVGDGINDAPALAAADVGIAIGTGTDIALATADIALLRGDLRALPRVFGLARATLRTIRQNLFWAFVYNVVGIPLAAGVLYPWTGWLLTPVFASAAMSLSSVSVLANSLRLRRFGG